MKPVYDIDMKIELFLFKVCFWFSLSSSQCISNKFSSWRFSTAHQFQTLYVTNRIVFCVSYLLIWNFIWINCLSVAKLYQSFKTTCLKTFTKCIQSIFFSLSFVLSERWDTKHFWRTISQTFSFFFLLSRIRFHFGQGKWINTIECTKLNSKRVIPSFLLTNATKQLDLVWPQWIIPSQNEEVFLQIQLSLIHGLR